MLGGEFAEPRKSARRSQAVYPLSMEGPTHAIEPLPVEKVKDSIKRGVEFLLETQLKTGSVGTFREWQVLQDLGARAGCSSCLSHGNDGLGGDVVRQKLGPCLLEKITRNRRRRSTGRKPGC